jgi:enoyl-CoA hydratase/carnithine racemase
MLNAEMRHNVLPLAAVQVPDHWQQCPQQAFNSAPFMREAFNRRVCNDANGSNFDCSQPQLQSASSTNNFMPQTNNNNFLPQIQQNVAPQTTQAAAVNVNIQIEGSCVTISCPQAECLSKDVLESLFTAIEMLSSQTSCIFAVFIWLKPGGGRLGMPPPSGGQQQRSVDELVTKIKQLPQVVVGLAQGRICSQGSSILCACDMVMASQDADFVLVSDDERGSSMLPICVLKRLGIGVAEELLGGSGTINAWRARELGLVKVVCDGLPALLHRKGELAGELGAVASPQSMALFKCLLQAGSSQRQDSTAPPPTSTTQEWGQENSYEPHHTSERRLQGQRKHEDTTNCAAFGEPVPAMPASMFPDNNYSGDMQPHPALSDFYRSQCDQPYNNSYEQSDDMNDSRNWDRGDQGQRSAHRHDLASQFSNYEGPITSMMICDLPSRITPVKVSEALNEKGFKGKYDFLYIPMAQNGQTNPGYGFVNFSNPEDACQFAKVFSGYKFSDSHSNKTCHVRPAHVQGTGQNLRSVTPFQQAPHRPRRKKGAK